MHLFKRYGAALIALLIFMSLALAAVIVWYQLSGRHIPALGGPGTSLVYFIPHILTMNL